jgi:hypothetical protein
MFKIGTKFTIDLYKKREVIASRFLFLLLQGFGNLVGVFSFVKLNLFNFVEASISASISQT